MTNITTTRTIFGIHRWWRVEYSSTLFAISFATKIFIPSGSANHSFSKFFYLFRGFIKFTMARATKLLPVRDISSVLTGYITPFKNLRPPQTTDGRTLIGFSLNRLYPLMNSMISDFISFPAKVFISNPPFVVKASRTTERAELVSFSSSRFRTIETLISKHRLNLLECLSEVKHYVWVERKPSLNQLTT